MSNNHKEKDKLTSADVMIMFVMKAPDMRKATGALMLLYGPKVTKSMMDRKNQFKSYQGWRVHLIAALDNAQEKIDATR